MFNDEQLKDLVQHSLAQPGVVSPDKRAALFTGLTTEGVRAVFALKVKDGWALNVYAEHDFHGDTPDQAGVLLKGSW